MWVIDVGLPVIPVTEHSVIYLSYKYNRLQDFFIMHYFKPNKKQLIYNLTDVL